MSHHVSYLQHIASLKSLSDSASAIHHSYPPYLSVMDFGQKFITAFVLCSNCQCSPTPSRCILYKGRYFDPTCLIKSPSSSENNREIFSLSFLPLIQHTARPTLLSTYTISLVIYCIQSLPQPTFMRASYKYHKFVSLYASTNIQKEIFTQFNILYCLMI